MKQFIARYPLLLALILLAVILRLYRVTNEPLDWHAWRQADTASVTRNFATSGITLLRPTYHDVSSIPSGVDNPSGWRMVEFPFVNAIVAVFLQLIPGVSVATMSRLVSIVFSAGTLGALFFLVKALSGKKLAYTAVLVFATLPFAVFYGRSILPEPALLFFAVTSLATFQRWLQTGRFNWYVLSIVTLALALLLKPFVLFLGPVYCALLLTHKGKRALALWPWLVGYLVFSITPFLSWRSWIQNFPEGIPASDWLFNGNGIRFRPAWVRWLGFERMVKLILGFVGVIPLVLGLLKANKHTPVYWSWWLGIGLYFTVIATGNVQHDYYQVFALPIIAITVAQGLLTLYKILRKHTHHLTSLGVVSLVYGLCLFFSWHQVKGYFNINHPEYSRVGARVKALTPPEALVIAPAMGDTQFLYQTHRSGWPIGSSIDEKIRQGATHYVTTTKDDEAQLLEEHYFVLEKTEEYLIIDLTKPRETP